jgi:predicted CxxxxCH...CXXCH cytochrome family protein
MNRTTSTRNGRAPTAQAVALAITLTIALTLGAAVAGCSDEPLADGLPGDELAGCSGCHGSDDSAAPPVGLDGETETTALAVGAHQAHLQDGRLRQAVGCAACHQVPAAVTAPGHIDGRPAELTWGSLAFAGGARPQWNRAAETCSSVYCHGATLAGGSASTPKWTLVDGSQTTCGSCHGDPPPPPHPQSEACSGCHPGTVNEAGEILVEGGQHIDGRVQAVSGGAGCSACHGGVQNAAPPVDLDGSSDPGQVTVGAHQAHLRDGALRVALPCAECHRVPVTVDAEGHLGPRPAELTFGALATTGGAAPAWDRAAATCSATYCHGATLAGGTATAPVWTRTDGSQTTCGSCHGDPPPPPHPQGGACRDCHPRTVRADGTIDVAGRRHLNGRVDVEIGGCNACHGNERNPAPPVALDGATATTDPGVGAHQAHLAGGRVAGPVECSACHLVPATTDAPGHIDGGPAELTWSARASAGGLTPRYDFAAHTCSATYCHGGTLSGGTHQTPDWTVVDGSQVTCASCHGFPPPLPHPDNPACDTCHPGTLSGPDTIDLAGGQHIDGTVQLARGCTVCHGGAGGPAPPVSLSGATETTALGVGAHQAHLQGGTLRAAIACGECHPAVTSVAGHIDGIPAELVWGALATGDGAAPSFDRTTATCSSTYCHGGTLGGGSNTTPQWTLVDGSQDACGTCHGAPPPPPHPAEERCETCHPGTMAADGGIDVAGGLHINGRVDFPTGSCTPCHGGGPNGPAPPPDLSGSSDPARRSVGAHTVHLQGGPLSGGFACSECHVVPATVTAPGHLDTLPAELTFGDLATADGATPAWDAATATCSSTYCHGATLGGGGNKAPVWTILDGTQAGCGQCHGFPPPAPHPQVFQCDGCHPNTVRPDGTIDVEGGRHVNGVIDAP